MLIEYLAQHQQRDGLTLHAGISYRHLLVMEHGKTGNELTPPHDITGKPVRGHLPQGPAAETLLGVMKLAAKLLKGHPVNHARIAAGKKPANAVWFWGEGTRPKLENFESKFGVKGAIISAVDLIKGIGLLSGMRVLNVDGATGNYDTNFAGKANAALDALKDVILPEPLEELYYYILSDLSEYLSFAVGSDGLVSSDSTLFMYYRRLAQEQAEEARLTSRELAAKINAFAAQGRA